MTDYIKKNATPMAVGAVMASLFMAVLQMVSDTVVKVALILAK